MLNTAAVTAGLTRGGLSDDLRRAYAPLVPNTKDAAVFDRRAWALHGVLYHLTH